MDVAHDALLGVDNLSVQESVPKFAVLQSVDATAGFEQIHYGLFQSNWLSKSFHKDI
jgi:hypothetical protein